MIVRRLLLNLKPPVKHFFDHIPDGDNDIAFKVGFKFAVCADSGPAIRSDDDDIVGWVIGDSDATSPLYFALRRNGDIDSESRR